MAAGPIGACWAAGSWADTCWGQGTWGGASVVPVAVVQGTGGVSVWRRDPFVERRGSQATAHVRIRAFTQGQAHRGGRGLALAPLVVEVVTAGQKQIGSGELAGVHMSSLPYRRQVWPVAEASPVTIVQRVYMPVYLPEPKTPRADEDDADLLALLELA